MVRVILCLFALFLFQVILKSKQSFIGIHSLNKTRVKVISDFRSGKVSAVKKHYF